MAWAAITTSVRKGFLRTSIKDVVFQFHASVFNGLKAEKGLDRQGENKK